MKVKAQDLKIGDIMCVGGQIGEFLRLDGKSLVYRPFGCRSTRRRIVRTKAQALSVMSHEIKTEVAERWVPVVR